jgi:hypothetical protein
MASSSTRNSNLPIGAARPSSQNSFNSHEVSHNLAKRFQNLNKTKLSSQDNVYHRERAPNKEPVQYDQQKGAKAQNNNSNTGNNNANYSQYDQKASKVKPIQNQIRSTFGSGTDNVQPPRFQRQQSRDRMGFNPERICPEHNKNHHGICPDTICHSCGEKGHLRNNCEVKHCVQCESHIKWHNYRPTCFRPTGPKKGQKAKIANEKASKPSMTKNVRVWGDHQRVQGNRTPHTIANAH